MITYIYHNSCYSSNCRIHFICIKKNENDLRAAISQDKLSSLGVLTVEKVLAKNTNLDDIINEFAMIRPEKEHFN
jgi:hypothetical protein